MTAHYDAERPIASWSTPRRMATARIDRGLERRTLFCSVMSSIRSKRSGGPAVSLPPSINPHAAAGRTIIGTSGAILFHRLAVRSREQTRPNLAAAARNTESRRRAALHFRFFDTKPST